MLLLNKVGDLMKEVIHENRTKIFTAETVNGLSPIAHFHKEIEIIYVIKGWATAWADRKKHILNEGDLFLCFPNEIHYYESTKNSEYYVLIPNPDIVFGLKDVFYDNVPLTNSFHARGNAETIGLLEKIFNYNGEYNRTVIVGIINQLLGEILPYFELKDRIKTDNSTLKNVLKYCNENFNNYITLDSVAESLHISKYYISHLLNEKLNMNFNTYINMLRINLACDLLTETDKKIVDISEDVGFGSIRSFNRAFSQIIGDTPIMYRNKNK